MKLFSEIKSRLSVSRKDLLIYLILYFCAGVVMNHLGKILNIARFMNDWQIISCYLLYMVPVSLLIRKESTVYQYLWGLLAISLLEFGGYALGTSIILGMGEHSRETMTVINNPVAKAFGLENFALGMSLFFAVYFPLGNAAVKRISGILTFKAAKKPLQRKAVSPKAARASTRQSR